MRSAAHIARCSLQGLGSTVLIIGASARLSAPVRSEVRHMPRAPRRPNVKIPGSCGEDRRRTLVLQLGFRRFMRNLLTALLATGALLGAAGSASATTVGTSFTVSATVLKTCSVAATNLGFGNYVPGSGVVPTATSTISVNCSKGTGFTVALDKGT